MNNWLVNLVHMNELANANKIKYFTKEKQIRQLSLTFSYLFT